MAACSEKSTNIEVNADILLLYEWMNIYEYILYFVIIYNVINTTYTTVYTQL